MDPRWMRYKDDCSFFHFPGFDQFIQQGSTWQAQVDQYKIDIKKFTTVTCDQYLKTNQNGQENLAEFLAAQKPIMDNLKPIEEKSLLLNAYLKQNYEAKKKKWAKVGINFSKLYCGAAFVDAVKTIQTEKSYILAKNIELHKCVTAAAEIKPQAGAAKVSAFQPKAAVGGVAKSAKGLDVQRSDITKRRPASETTPTK